MVNVCLINNWLMMIVDDVSEWNLSYAVVP